jgi:hypothetical protein
MSADIERTLILERHRPALDLLGVSDLVPEQHLTIELQDDGSVLLCEKNGEDVSVIVLGPVELDTIQKARAEQMTQHQRSEAKS